MLPFIHPQYTGEEIQYPDEYPFTPTPVCLNNMSGDWSLPQTTQTFTPEMQILNYIPSFHSDQYQWTHSYNPENISLTNLNVYFPNYSVTNTITDVSSLPTTQTTFDWNMDREISQETFSNCNDSTRKKTQLTEGNNYTAKEQFSCKVCFKKLNSERSLIFHERIHRDEKPFPCLICGIFFRTKAQLKRHGYTHSEEKPFKCSECGKGFRHRSNLYDHKSIHMATRPHECPVCHKKFRLKATFSTHFYTHVDCKPFRCSCGKSFLRKWYLDVHLGRSSSYGHVAAINYSS